MSIPVLIVPVLNGHELVIKMLLSIDHPVDRVVVIDNSHNGAMSEWWPAGPPETDPPSPIGRIQLVQPGHNLGVSGAWNLGLKVAPQAPWWLIVNHDIQFGPGDLGRLDVAVDPDSDTHYFMLGMAAFALTRHTLSKVGYFDENFHPAYDEDLDWDRRAKLVGCERIEVGFSGSHVGSATIHSDPSLRRQNGRTHMSNDLYYSRKWGGPKQGGERFSTPFNRGGHVGDWRLEPERLRLQAWNVEKET